MNRPDVNISHQAKHGNTPLIHAAAHGHHTLATLLLQHPDMKSIDTSDNDGMNLLSYAAQNQDIELAVLLDYGADPFLLPPPSSPSPADFYLESRRPRSFISDLKKIFPLTYFIRVKPISPRAWDCKNKDRTALFRAVVRGDIKSTVHLRLSGASANILNEEGDTPLLYLLRSVNHLVEKKYRVLILMLVHFGADLNVQSKAGETVLGLAGEYARWDYEPVSGILGAFSTQDKSLLK